MRSACTAVWVVAGLFLLLPLSGHTQDIVKAEYFFNTDPGPGNGIPIAVTPGSTVTVTTAISTAALPQGFHLLGLRAMESGGIWTHNEARGFYITTPAAPEVADITAAEYFFNLDPGVGNGTPIPFTAGPVVSLTVALPTTSLPAGFHLLSIRTRDGQGRWSLYEARGFFISTVTTDVPDITAAEYFYDLDPGPGNGTPIPISAGPNPNVTVALPTSGLAPGFHFLGIRTKRADGTWGLFERGSFYIAPIVAPTGDIVAAEYFIDTDPGTGNGTAISVAPTGATINQVFTIPLPGVPSGGHKLGFRVKDATGNWSAPEMKDFTVLACTPPVAPTAPGVSRCGPGTVELKATAGATGSQVYRWYATATSSVVLFTGATFTTPAVSATTSYFASVYDPVTLCESNRTAVPATVISNAAPALNVTSATICEGSTIRLSAPAGFTSYLWSPTNETTREIVVAASGEYTVVVGTGTCLSLPSSPASITVSPKPPKPVINPLGDTNLCSGGSVGLEAPAGFASYLWSDGRTTQTISATVPGPYTVFVTNASGCGSDPSNSIIVSTFTTPAKPVITASGSTTLCPGGSVKLSAPTGFGSYIWSNGETTREVVVNTAGSYTVVVGNGSCLSPTSDPAVVTVSLKPAQPVITPSGSTSFCDGGSVTLSAPGGFSSYLWSDGRTTPEIVATVAGNYSVVVSNSAGCTSDSSNPVVVTSVAAPPKPIIVPAGSTTICQGASIKLSAPAGFTTYLWSGGETTREVVVSIAGNYTVVVGNGTCTSPLSDVVVIAVSAKPAKPVITASGSTNLCDGAGVTLSALGESSSYLWSDGRTTRNIVVTVAGTYTLTVRDAANCQSDESNGIEVKTFVTPPKPDIEKLGSTTLCGTNTVGLLAPLGYSFYSWTPGGQTTAGLTVSTAGSYAVRVGQASNCLSVASDPVVVITTGQPCTLTVDPVNQPPVIASARATTTIGGRIVLPLAGLISDPDNAINPSSLRVAKLPSSGAKAEIILARQELVVDYAGIDFAGQETVTVQICDVSASCSQQQIVIDITGAVKVYNVITPNGDGLNDGLYIEYIAILEEARNNTVRIFNRWGDLLYEAENYNNGTISFKGIATNGDPIPTGTYFYRIDFKSGLPPVTGYFSIRR